MIIKFLSGEVNTAMEIIVTSWLLEMFDAAFMMDPRNTTVEPQIQIVGTYSEYDNLIDVSKGTLIRQGYVFTDDGHYELVARNLRIKQYCILLYCELLQEGSITLEHMSRLEHYNPSTKRFSSEYRRMYHDDDDEYLSRVFAGSEYNIRYQGSFLSGEEGISVSVSLYTLLSGQRYKLLLIQNDVSSFRLFCSLAYRNHEFGVMDLVQSCLSKYMFAVVFELYRTRPFFTAMCRDIVGAAIIHETSSSAARAIMNIWEYIDDRQVNRLINEVPKIVRGVVKRMPDAPNSVKAVIHFDEEYAREVQSQFREEDLERHELDRQMEIMDSRLTRRMATSDSRLTRQLANMQRFEQHRRTAHDEAAARNERREIFTRSRSSSPVTDGAPPAESGRVVTHGEVNRNDRRITTANTTSDLFSALPSRSGPRTSRLKQLVTRGQHSTADHSTASAVSEYTITPANRTFTPAERTIVQSSMASAVPGRTIVQSTPANRTVTQNMSVERRIAQSTPANRTITTANRTVAQNTFVGRRIAQSSMASVAPGRTIVQSTPAIAQSTNTVPERITVSRIRAPSPVLGAAAAASRDERMYDARQGRSGDRRINYASVRDDARYGQRIRFDSPSSVRSGDVQQSLIHSHRPSLTQRASTNQPMRATSPSARATSPSARATSPSAPSGFDPTSRVGMPTSNRLAEMYSGGAARYNDDDE